MRRFVQAIWLTISRLVSMSLFSPVRSAQRVVRHCDEVMATLAGPLAASAKTRSRARLIHCMMWNPS